MKSYTVHGITYLTHAAAAEAADNAPIAEEEFTGFVTGQRYDEQSVRDAEFTIDDAGYQIGDYFDAVGRYLGPDDDGVEPTHNELA